MASVQPFNRNSADGARRRAPLTLAALATLYLFDAAVLGQGFVAAALLTIVALGLLPKWFVLRHIGAVTWPTSRLAVMFTTCAIAIMATINFNNSLARARGEALVTAISHYRAIAGRYPRALDDLVPTYIEAIPRAKYTLSFNRFDYSGRGDRVVLAYADTPPFGRSFYDFKHQRWRAPAH